MIEMLVATIIFAFITGAISFSLSTALQARETMMRVNDQNMEMDTILDTFKRDIENATSWSTQNSNSFFVCQGTSSGPLLLLSTFNRGLTNPPMQNMTGINAGVNQSINPQSDQILVGYYFDPSSMQLQREAINAPNRTLLPGLDSSNAGSSSTSPLGNGSGSSQYGAEQLISSHVEQITFTFTDQNGNQDSTWQYDPTLNPQGSASGSASGSAQTGTQSGVQSDTQLPMFVHIDITLKFPDGEEKTGSISVSPACLMPYSAQTLNSGAVPQ